MSSVVSSPLAVMTSTLTRVFFKLSFYLASPSEWPGQTGLIEMEAGSPVEIESGRMTLTSSSAQMSKTYSPNLSYGVLKDQSWH